MIPDPKIIGQELWLDFKENWQEWLKFLLWEVPTDIGRMIWQKIR